MVEDLKAKKVPYDDAVEEASSGLKQTSNSLKNLRSSTSRARNLKKAAESNLEREQKTIMDEREKLR